jgi:hypothetical protein
MILQIKVVDALLMLFAPGENGDLVNIVVVYRSKGMFLDLPREA